MKRLLSMFLVVAILFSIIPANVFAENVQSETSAQSQTEQATVNNENLTVTGSNHIGNLVSKDIQQEQGSSAEALQTGYDVVSLTVENNTATVEYFAKDAASVVVAIYTNDRSQLLTSSTVNVTADETVVTLVLPDALPEYFHASAYMVSPKDQKPLCTALHTSMYTKEIQELLQSTINDYNPDLVVNLDERTDTNFAVYNEDTVVIQEQSGVNTVVSADDDNLTYVIDNPSQEIRSLMYGDVLSLPYGDEDILFVKVDRVDIGGNTATITGLPIELEDVFSYVKIDGDAGAANAEVDTTTADEGVTFEGIFEEPATRAIEGEATHSHKLSYHFFKDVKAGPEGNYGELTCQLNGSFELKLAVSVEYYVALSKREFKFSVDGAGSFVIGFEGTAKLTIPLGKVSVPAFAGVKVGLEPELVFELKGKAEATVSIATRLGFSYATGQGFKNISEPPKATVFLEAEATFFVGIDLAPNVSVIDPRVVKVTVSIPIGVELTAKMTGSAYEGLEALTENNHACTHCVDIGLDGKREISVKLTFLNKPRWTREFKVIEIKEHLLDAYYSIDHDEFGWTKCPHKAYPLTITVLDSADQPITGVTIQCSPEDCTLKTNSDGKTTVYLPDGKYTLTATKGDYAGSGNVKVNKDTSTTLRVILTGTVTENVKWSLTESGALTIFGNGAIPDYAASSQLPWSPYISKVKSVSISDGITAIGANAFRDHTDLTSVYIGNSVSNIAFSAFEGLNLSMFAVSSANPYFVSDQKGVLYNKNKTTLYKAFLPLNLTYDIPDTVTNIASEAFAGQTGITLIHFKGDAPTIASDAFSGMNSEALYCTRTSGWTQDKLQQYGGTITWGSYDGLLGSGTFGNQFIWQVDNDGVLRISGAGELTGHAAASQTPWYRYRENIKTVVLSRGITAIGNYAFAECTALETITIPTVVDRIGKYAFYNCSSLTDISIPEGISTIESYAFYGCSSLQSISIPESVTAIAAYTFYNCSSLQELPLHDGIATIGEYAFYNCSSFRELVIPNAVTEIGQYAFALCSGVLNLRIRENGDPDFAGLTIGTYAFRNCTSLRTAKLPDSTVLINESIFSGCGSLESISIPFIGDQKRSNTETTKYPLGYVFGTSNYTGAMSVSQNYGSGTSRTYYIPSSLKTVIVTGGEVINYAFKNCTNLQTVVIPETATVIGRYAFEMCIGIQEIIIPDSITIIGVSAFGNCSGLTSIDIPDGVTIIGDYAFDSCSSLTSITIPDGIISINVGVFRTCYKLTDITIPDSVTSIGDGAFENCGSSGLKTYDNAKYLGNNKNPYMVLVESVSTDITSCTLHGDTKFVHPRAFEDCSRLTSITIPDSVTSIGDYAFYNCSKLISISFSKNSQLTNFGGSAFKKCGSLESITLPEGVTSIGGYAFHNCSSLTSVTLGENSRLISIGSYAFEGCTSLTYNIYDNAKYFGNSENPYVVLVKRDSTSITSCTIPDGTKNICDYAFSGCSNLSSITIPDSVSSIGISAFNSCTSLTSVTIPDGVSSIGESAFRGCTGLTNITIPDGVTSIGDYVFSGCNSLTSIAIPDSITSIGDSAFSGCRSLTSITIPDSITSIGNSAFYNCKLTGVYITDIAAWCNIKFGDDDANPLYYAKKLYLNKQLVEALVIPDGVASIGSYAFLNCSSLTSITVPSGVTSIGESAFRGCTGLTNITIPDGVTSIGESAFRGCTGLTNIIIPDGVTSIGDYTFVYCINLSSITIPDSVTSIGASAFSECYNLTSVTFGENSQLAGIGDSAFYNCSNLITITIPDSVTSIGENAFDYCIRLISVTFDENSQLTSIGNAAFEDCRSLTSITIPDNVESVGDSVLAGCSVLKEINFRGDALTIGSDAFLNVTATAYYPAGNATWTSSVMQNYGGTITWKAYTATKALCYSVTTDREVEGTVSSSSSTSAQKSGSTKMRTVTFEDLEPGEEYIFLSLVSENEENPLIYENLLFIDQLCADENGVITVSYRPRFASNSVCELVRGGAVKNLTEATVIWTDYTENGAQQFFAPTVSYNGEELTENVDYVLEGEISFSVPGTYQCYVVGIGDYIGSYPCTYIVAENANRYSEGLSYTLSSNGDSYAVSGIGTCTDTEIVIPAKYNDLPVASIGSSAFSACQSITSVVIPDSVTSIGNSAFYNCSNLTSITVPDSVTSIGGYAFYYCSSLSSITIGDGVTSIGYSTFSGCSSLTSITVPDSVTSIGDFAFFDCDNLTSINIPDRVTSIGYRTFYQCIGLTSVTFDENSRLTSIGNDAFLNCSSLTSITVPSGVTSIGNYVFQNCSSLTSITIPDGVTSIGTYAFQNCSSLTSITIPDSVTSIGNYVFQNCGSLTSITIPESVTSIGTYVFQNCSSLMSITISDSVTSIGNSAFQNCSSLTGITIPESVTSIGNSAFSGCSSLTSITIPESVTSIGNSAFSGCSSLTSITIPESVTSIGNSAFQNCSSLTSITIPDSVTSIGNYVFQNCSSLTSITIPESVTSIGTYVFRNCSSLMSITIPDSVTSIGNSAFQNCSSLASITIPDSVTSIGNYAFYNCSSLTSITIPESVTSIGNSAFYNCSNLTSITIPDSVTSIGNSAFQNCSSLISITIPDSVTSIGTSAFSGCSGLTGVWASENNPHYSSDAYGVLYNKSKTELMQAPGGLSGAYTIPDSVTSIGNYAFYNCSSLTSITIPDSVTSIGSTAFENCSIRELFIAEGSKKVTKDMIVSKTTLENIVIPDSVTDIPNSVFRGCGSLESLTIPYVGYLGAFFGQWDYPGAIALPHHYYISSQPYYIPGSLRSVTVTGGEIGAHAFFWCSQLTSITLGDNVTSIQEHAFDKCHGLSGIIVPDGITSIGDYAFYACIGLTSITIPDSVTSIGDKAFYECSSLTDVYYAGTSAQWQSITIGTSNSALTGAEIHYIHNHDYSQISPVTVEPTCTAEGYTEYTCACGKKRRADYTPALGHSLENGRCTLCGSKLVDLKLTTVTLRPGAAGLYFSGEFNLAEGVVIKRQGIVVSLVNRNPVADGSDETCLWSVGGTSVLVQNILSTDNSAVDNALNSTMPIYARAYVELEDGNIVYSDTVGINLLEVVQTIDGQWSNLTDAQKAAILAMYADFKETMDLWKIPNIKAA